MINLYLENQWRSWRHKRHTDVISGILCGFSSWCIFSNFFTGVPRVTKKEREFANFSIFDDPKKPYSSFKFQYDHQSFDRLHELMKFNTLLNVDLIKEKIASQVLLRKNNKEMPLRWMFLYQDNITNFHWPKKYY